MYHVIVLLGFPEIIFFSLCVSHVLFYVNWWPIIFDTRLSQVKTAVSYYNFIPFLLEHLFHLL